MLKRFLAVLKARNLEYFRDRSSLGWNVAFPFFIVIGFYFIFNGDDKSQYKVGLLKTISQSTSEQAPLLDLKHIEFVFYEDKALAQFKLQQHAIDLLVDIAGEQYWLNASSPKGYIAEKLLLSTTQDYSKNTLTGREIRYLDWVLPGILGMNMMFSCLFGVGYVIVRYRKNGVLKRLQATPLSALEFLLAQVVSRLFIVLLVSIGIYVACDLMFDFYMVGSYLTLFLVAVLGAFSMIALGLMIASRSRSEELTGGLLNLVSWPMMMLSSVWFSMEGSSQFMQNVAQIFPLTHLVGGARAVMTEGAALSDLGYSIGLLCVMTIIFLAVGAALFRWEGDSR